MSHLIGKTEGVYNPSRRFAFTNITEEDFVSAWDGSPITIKPGQTVELSHHLADKLTDELVDKIMIGNAKLDEVAKNQPYYRSPQGMNLGVPAARKVWGDQIVRELSVDEESPEIQVMRAEIKSQLMEDLNKEVSSGPPVLPIIDTEFAGLKEEKVIKAPKKALKLKSLK